MMPANFTHLDLFAGIGLRGFSRAVHWLGGTTVGFVEWDAWNRRVLAKHWPEAHFHGDIKTLTAATLREWGISTHSHQLGEPKSEGSPARGIRGGSSQSEPAECHAGQGGNRAVDLITGGYPCQPFSLAGQRLGAEDDRHLWPEMRRVIDLCRPRFILAENVAGHITMGLDTVLAELEEDGYTCGAIVVPACAVNALHRRDRVWIMAHSERGEHEQPEGISDRGRGWITDSGTPLQRDIAANGESARTIDGLANTSEGGWGARQRDLLQGQSDPTGSGARVANAERGGRGQHLRTHAEREPLREAIGTQGTSGTRPGGIDRGERHDQAGNEIARPLDARADELSAGLVRRPAGGPTEPDLIRAAWADGSWEHDLPRVVADEPERRQKLQAAGNAIVAVVAYEILSVMLGEAA